MALPIPRETGVQHHPNLLRLIEANFNKVVTGSQRSQVLVVIGVKEARIFTG
ncbi:Uncharacterised protein [Klebsiella oxytoca]|nr:Uncharacterised protein [Klebsiella oxytoca]